MKPSLTATLLFHDDAMAGRNLEANEVRDLEVAVARKPDDLSARTKLLGYYFGGVSQLAAAKESRRKHILWIIENCPEAAIAGLPYCGIMSEMDQVGYDEAKKLWLEKTQAHSQNATILGHAATFLILDDENLAEDLLKQAQKIEPGNSQRSDQLGQFYATRSEKDSGTKALAEFEKAQAADPEELPRFYRLNGLAKAAFKAGELEKASQYANEALKEAGRFPNDWNYGNAIHHGNGILGSVALKQDDPKKAVEYLLKAGKTPGSPQLNSFGPNMSLAKDLLEKGENEAVLKYFELCRKFWAMGGESLDHWTKEVKAGLAPDFGGNLGY